MTLIPILRHSSKILPLHKKELLQYSESNPEKIVISSAESLQVIPLQKVLYFKSDSNYTQIRLEDGKEHLVSKTLKVFDLKLNNNFLRVHNSYVINLDHIKSYCFKTCNIVLQDDISIPVSRRNKPEVIAYLRSFEL